MKHNRVLNEMVLSSPTCFVESKLIVHWNNYSAITTERLSLNKIGINIMKTSDPFCNKNVCVENSQKKSFELITSNMNLDWKSVTLSNQFQETKKKHWPLYFSFSITLRIVKCCMH